MGQGNIFRSMGQSFCPQGGAGEHARQGSECGSWGMHAGGHVCQGACIREGGGLHTGETATEVEGTHPTGMHSCTKNTLYLLFYSFVCYFVS